METYIGITLEQGFLLGIGFWIAEWVVHAVIALIGGLSRKA